MGTKARNFSRSLGSGGGFGANLTLEALRPFLTTANVIEGGTTVVGANLYFTNSRVFSNIEMASIDVFRDVDTSTRLPSFGDVLVYNGNVWAPNSIADIGITFTTDDIPEGNVNFFASNTRVRGLVGAANPTIIYDPNTGLFAANLEAVAASANTTDSLPEGFVNYYYTNARVFANLQLASINDLNDVLIQSNLWGPLNPGRGLSLIYDFINPLAPGEGIYWKPMVPPFSVQSNITASLSNHTTNKLAEGNVNLYFTNTRVESIFANLIALTSIADLVDVTDANIAAGKVLTWTGSIWEPIALANVGNVGSAFSSQFAENSNRANIALFANVAAFALLAGVANVALRAPVANTVDSLDGLTTDDLAEGTANLYFTEQRVVTVLANVTLDAIGDVETANATNGDLLFYNGTRWISSNVVSQSASSQFAQRAGFANVALEANYANTAGVSNTVLSLAGLTTDNLIEGASNLYYSTQRLNNDIQSVLLGKDINLDDLVVTGDLTVQGNTVILNVANLQTEAKQLILNDGSTTPAEAEGSGIVIEGANASILYGELTDSLGVNKNLVVYGNIIPALDSRFSLGLPGKIWRNLYLGARTLFMGNLVLTENPDGSGLLITDQFGEPAGLGLANIQATQSVTVDRIIGNVSPEVEIRSYLGGNTEQFLTGTTGNLFVGVLKDGRVDRFSGMRIIQKYYEGNSATSDVVFYNDREPSISSTARLSLLGNGNVEVQADTVTVNGNTLTQIARAALSTNNPVISDYTNTYPTIGYSPASGIISINKDGVYQATAFLTLTTDWQDTPIQASFIPTGTYVVQIQVNDNAQGGGHYNEYYSGVMSWYSLDTDSAVFDEIALHRAGRGPGSGTIFLRVQRTVSSSNADLKLQIAGSTENTDIALYNFKFRRLL